MDPQQGHPQGACQEGLVWKTRFVKSEGHRVRKGARALSRCPWEVETKIHNIEEKLGKSLAPTPRKDLHAPVGLAFAERTVFGAEACENSTGAGSTLFTGVSTVLDPHLTWNGDKTSFLAGRKRAGGEEEH